MLLDEPGKFSEILDFAVDVAIEYGISQIDAGVHFAVVCDPCASQAVIPPRIFQEFDLLRIKKIMKAFTKAGALANCIVTPGPTLDLLKFYPEMGVHIVGLDYYVDPLEAREVVPNICLLGNIKSMDFIEETPEAIRTRSLELLNKMKNTKGFMLASGFEIPLESKPKNIEAMVQAVQQV